jgi:flavodoxin
MRKILKIVIAVIAIIVILAVAFGALIFLDLAAFTATGSQTLTPTGTSIGKALVTYDPGLSGKAKTVAEKVANDLQTQNYTVVLAGIKSSEAANATGFSIVVVGGPVYAGSATASVKDFLDNLNPGYASPGYGPYMFIKLGMFESGSGATSPDDIAAIKRSVPVLSNSTFSNPIIIKIGQNEDLNTRAQEFVNQLIQ